MKNCNAIDNANAGGCLRQNNVKYLAVIALALIQLVSIGSTAAYFTSFVSAEGGHELILGEEAYVEEVVTDNQKTISIRNIGGTDDAVNSSLYVRVKLLYSDYNNDVTVTLGKDWAKGSDGYYYYEKILKPGKSTTNIEAKIDLTDEGAMRIVDQFDVIVASESTQYIYEGPNNPSYKGWTK